MNKNYPGRGSRDNKTEILSVDIRVNVWLVLYARAAGRVVERHVGRGAGQARGLLSGYFGLLP